MRKLFTVFMILVLGVSANAQTDCSELYFSEYIEGGGYNKAIEIYNPSSSEIDLSSYVLVLLGNGNVIPTDTIMFSKKVPAGDVFVVAHTSAADSIKDVADRLDGGIANWNGDDAIALVKIVGMSIDTIDVFGVVGERKNWTVGNDDTKDNTIKRKASVKHGTKKWDANEWVAYAKDLTVFLGAHSSACHAPTITKPTV
ncbi:MAG: lamin tail domain-containing protein, partial [Bacteroidia bacterium]